MAKKNWLLKTGFNVVSAGLTIFGLGGMAYLGEKLFSDNDEDAIECDYEEDDESDSNEDEGD